MFRLFKGKREAIKKYLMIVFLSIVSIGMIVTLAPITPTSDTGLEPNVLAEINGVRITSMDLSRNIQARLRNSPLANDPELVARMATILLDDMILRRALWTQAEKLGVSVSDAEVRHNVETSMPFLYPNGVFVGLDTYRDFVSRQAGMSVQQFEAQLREGILQEKMRAIITDGARVTPAEVREEYIRRNSKARIEYVLFDPSQYLQTVEATPAALEEFFKKDSAKYQVPEERRVEYVLIDMDRVRAEVKVDDDEMKTYYSRHLAEYQVPERVKVSHILFKTEGKTPEEVAAVEQKAGEVLAQIKSGGDFAELARQNSEDSSATSGGDIGWIVRGQTVKEFEDAAFTMKPGQVSDIIKTTYGFHIIKVFDKQTAHLQTFEEVRSEIREQLQKEKLADAQHSLATGLEQEFQQDPQNFAAVAQKHNLQVRKTPLFRYNQPVTDMGTSEGFHNLAFQLREGGIGSVSVPKGMAIIQMIEVVQEHLPKLEDVRAAVEQDYRAAQSQVLAAEKAREFAAQAKDGDFQIVARSMGLTTLESSDFTQQEYVEGLGSGSALAAAFTMGAGHTSEVTAVGTNQVVFRVVDRTPADESGLTAQQDQLAEELLERKRNLAWEIYQQNVKDQLKASGQLKMNEAAMKGFLATYQRS